MDHDRVGEICLGYLWEEPLVILLILDRLGIILDANRHAIEMLPEGFRGKSLSELPIEFHARPSLAVLTANSQAVHRMNLSAATRVPQTYLFRCFEQGDHFVLIGRPDVEGLHETRAGLVSLHRELAEQVRTLHQASAKLERRNQLKNLLLGMATHDLRNPLTAILGFSEQLMRQTANSDSHDLMLARIHEAAKGMLRIVEDYLGLAIAESSELKLRRQPENLVGLINRARDLTAARAERNHVRIAVDDLDANPEVPVDGPKIVQVLGNLLTNAVQHSPEGAIVCVGLSNDRGNTVISVTDQGPGIAPEEAATLFQPFRSGVAAKSANEKSIGLGLFISRKIIEAHGGRIWIESGSGCGSAFRFSLPSELPVGTTFGS